MGTFAIGFLVLVGSGVGEDTDATCVPECRSGFTCVEGSCVSACNPPCSDGQTCTDAGMCEAAMAETAAPVAAASGMASGKEWSVSAAGGFLLGGTVNVEGADLDSDAGLMLLAGGDMILMPKFSVGGFALVAFSGIGGFSASIYTLGAKFKLWLPVQNFTIKPGLSIGYQIISPEVGDSTQGLDIGASVEGAMAINDDLDGLVEIGFITQPSGGNDAAEVTFGPIFYLVGGVAFGK